MFKKLLLSLGGLIMLTMMTTAQQVPAYAMVATSGTYTPITGGTTAILTYNNAANNDDGVSTPANAIPLGFTFNYNGTNYTTIRACANGFAFFSTTALSNGTDTWTNNLATGVSTTIRPIIAPLWDDLDMGAGSVTYQLSGTSPNQVLTIQWANAKWQFPAISGVISFQAKFYETSNIIEFVYRPESGDIANAGDLGASIGITAASTAAGTFLSLSDAGTAPSVSYLSETTTISTKPANGQTYRWIPYCSASATNTAGEKISNFMYGTINNNSTSTAGYENFSNVSTTTSLMPASTLPFSVTVANFTPTDQVIISLDLNHNGVFTDPGETLFTSTTPLASGTITGNITIPAFSPTVLQGNARLRIRLHDTGTGANATSCGTSTSGQVEDYNVNVQPCFPGAITTQPANTTVCNAGSTSITVGTSGTGLTYQWQVSTNGGTSYANISNDATYAGTTTSTLSINGATAAQNNNRYRVIVNGLCTVTPITSTGAILTVNVPAAITTQPVVNVKACTGSNASFTVSASGTSPTYQWQVSTDGGTSFSDIAGATNATLTLSPSTLAQNGNRYRANVSVGSCGTVVSSAGILTVNPLPVVTISAAPLLALKPGQTTTISAGSVSPGASFAWTLDGNTIAGATGKSIIADVNGPGTYKVKITDANGCVNTSGDLVITSEPSQALFIYPNPNNGLFQVRLYDGNEVTDIRAVSIYDAAGNLVIKKKFNIYNINNHYLYMSFDMTAMPKGLYFVRVSHKYRQGFVAEGKVVVQ